MNRRDFLAASCALTLGAALPDRLLAAGDRRLEKIGYQLYTARELMADDVSGTLDALAAIGYDEVEFAGYFDHSPAAIRAFLDGAGLAAPSAHVQLDDMRSRPGELIEAAETIGHDYLVLGWLAPPERETLDQYRAHADLCNRFAAECREAGIRFGWHNHEFEFEELEGQRPIDLLLAETDADLVKIELDLYWINVAGADPLEYFAKHPGRFPLCHVKDMAADGSFADAGSGTLDFAAIFAASDQAGLEHYFVERDDSPAPLATAESAYRYLDTLGF